VPRRVKRQAQAKIEIPDATSLPVYPVAVAASMAGLVLLERLIQSDRLKDSPPARDANAPRIVLAVYGTMRAEPSAKAN